MVLSVSFHFFKWLPAGIGPVADRQLSARRTRKADFPVTTQKRSLGGRSNLQTYRADQYKRYAQILYKT
jgi:hypothetical protein